MVQKILPICNYLLRTSPEVVKKLPRNDNLVTTINNKESRLVMFGNGESLRLSPGNTQLRLENIKLIVPEGIDIYRVIKKVRNSGEFFFSVKEGNDSNRAYFSELCNIQSFWQIGFEDEENVASLLSQTWYPHEKSSDMFNRLLHSGPNTNLYLEKECRTYGHPLLRDS